MLQNPKASGRLRSVRVGRTLRSANFQAGRPEDSESNRSARSTLRASAERSPARDPKSSPVPCRCTGVTAAAYSPPSRASASQGCQASRDRWTQIPGCLARRGKGGRRGQGRGATGAEAHGPRQGRVRGAAAPELAVLVAPPAQHAPAAQQRARVGLAGRQRDRRAAPRPCGRMRVGVGAARRSCWLRTHSERERESELAREREKASQRDR